MKFVSAGREVRQIKASGQDVDLVVQAGKPVYVSGSNFENSLDQLIPKTTRLVVDDGRTWMEFGFDLDVSEIPLTGSPATHWDADGYAFLYLEWRRNLTDWEYGKFIASPTGNETLGDGRTRFWNRAINPVSAPTATAPQLVCESTATSDFADSRNGPFTGIHIGGVDVSLPNAPYTMPSDAAALQADLRTAGYADATVTATSDVDWRIVLKNLTFGENQSAKLTFAEYLHHIDDATGYALYRSWLDFAGDRLDEDGNVIAPDGFAQLAIWPGARSGNPVLMIPGRNAIVAPLLPPDRFAGFRGGVGAYDPLGGVPSPTYPLARITGSQVPGATLTCPVYVWEDPGWSTLTIVGTWYKNGVATDGHASVFSDTAEGDVITYREVATNENGSSSVNDLAWPRFVVSQALIDAGLDDPDWLAPYAALADGTEASMIRFLDDPDVPCYQGVWMKTDKNRFHQARGSGGPKKYVLNPDLWCYAFRDSLSGVSVACDYPNPEGMVPDQNWMSKRGCVIVTDQHVVSCGHGPPELGITGFPSRIRFLGTDGNTYERNIVGKKLCLGNTSKVAVNGVDHGFDSWVGTLDSPLPAAVRPARIIPDGFFTKYFYGLTYWQLFVSQSMENESNSPADAAAKYRYQPYSNPDYTPAAYHPNYPSRQRTMCCVAGDHYPAVQYFPWAGDSGMPAFIATGTELLWSGFTAGGGSGPSSYPQMQDGVSISWEALNNAMIAAADADAISRGALAAPTGKTVTIFEL